MKKDKYPLAGGLIPGDPSQRSSGSGASGGAGSQTAGAAAAAAAAREMYSSMNGYMPNGYHAYDPSMYGQYGNGSSIYGRYDMYSNSQPPPPPGSAGANTTSSAAAMSSAAYMNGAAYMSMYGSQSPYGGGGSDVQQQHSPGGGSVKSESGGNVSMPSESPNDNYIKREVTPPAGSGSGSGGGSTTPGPGGQHQQQDLNRMISMYLPGDAAAAAAGDPNAQSRIQSMYAGHYQAMVGAATPAAAAAAAAAAADHLGPAGHPAAMAHM